MPCEMNPARATPDWVLVFVRACVVQNMDASYE